MTKENSVSIMKKGDQRIGQKCELCDEFVMLNDKSTLLFSQGKIVCCCSDHSEVLVGMFDLVALVGQSRQELVEEKGKEVE